ncbi:hypothetical protein ABTM27_20910, partial [Acinetobacter baumannii]
GELQKLRALPRRLWQGLGRIVRAPFEATWKAADAPASSDAAPSPTETSLAPAESEPAPAPSPARPVAGKLAELQGEFERVVEDLP